MRKTNVKAATLSAKPQPVIISGFSSQELSAEVARALHSRVVAVCRKQFNDKEIQTTIMENVRAQEVIVIASAAGDPNKQEKEARLLMRAASRSGAKKVTLVLPYMWYGRSDDSWDERNAPALVDTIESLRPHCDSVVIADPHNAILAREKFLDTGSRVKDCTVVHFAYLAAMQLKSLIESGIVSKDALLFAHADAGSTKRIGVGFRACLYHVLAMTRNPNEDDWAQGLKDREKTSGKSKIKGFSMAVEGRDVVIFEDLIASGGTICDLADLLKKMGARSVLVFATHGLFTTDAKKEQIAASVERIDRSSLDAIFIADTYNHSLTDPRIHEAIEHSPVIHILKTAPYLAAILRALHLEVLESTDEDENSISAIARGVHSEQTCESQRIARPVSLKPGNPLMAIKVE
jgi:ribose-phosphate pyrophosphokinase